jgi:hypothetical protein
MKIKENYKILLGLLLAAAIGGVGGYSLRQTQTAQLPQLLAIYETDAQQSAPQVKWYVRSAHPYTQQAQLERVGELLSQTKFCALPIQVTSLKDGIAIVNLSEHPWNQNLQRPSSLPGCSGMTWRYHYFQGSAGGYDTTIALTRTFTQPDYQGPWVKGVQFFYQGRPIEEGQWDHIDLDGVIARPQKP